MHASQGQLAHPLSWNVLDNKKKLFTLFPITKCSRWDGFLVAEDPEVSLIETIYRKFYASQKFSLTVPVKNFE